MKLARGQTLLAANGFVAGMIGIEANGSQLRLTGTARHVERKRQQDCEQTGKTSHRRRKRKARIGANLTTSTTIVNKKLLPISASRRQESSVESPEDQPQQSGDGHPLEQVIQATVFLFELFALQAQLIKTAEEAIQQAHALAFDILR